MKIPRWLEFQMKKICPRCKGPRPDTVQGLINLGGFIHDRDECPMTWRLQWCPHCGKDIE
jgi:hypothetical protein